MAYTKLFNSIVTSTIWTENDRTRVLWITMLALADKNGEVQGSVPGLARIAGVPVDDCRTAIAKFLAPDPDSRTKDDEGRRIAEIDGGWELLNHQKYREMASKSESREAEAKRKARYRAKLARNKKDEESVPQNVPECPGHVPETRHIAEAEAEADIKISSAKADSSSSGADGDADFVSFWAAYPRKVGKGQARKSWHRAKRERRLPDLSKVMTALDAATNSEQWQDSHLIPHPTTWLNRDGWEDEIAEFKKAPQLRGVRPPMVFDPADNVL